MPAKRGALRIVVTSVPILLEGTPRDIDPESAI